MPQDDASGGDASGGGASGESRPDGRARAGMGRANEPMTRDLAARTAPPPPLSRAYRASPSGRTRRRQLTQWRWLYCVLECFHKKKRVGKKLF